MNNDFKELNGLDLSALAQFKANDFLRDPGGLPGEPQQVALSLIDFDQTQPRRFIDEGTLDELAASIELHGVLEPVSLRSHPTSPSRFIVNRGERRVRAARKAGLAAVPAFLDERVDPYAQAVENLHRESMSPFDLATFIADREVEGHTRAEIARRLNKPRSFVTEAAGLIDAPEEMRRAFEAGRIGSDTRTLYRLARELKRHPAQAAAMLATNAEISRSSLDRLLGANALGFDSKTIESGPPPLQRRSGGRTVLVVEHAGRRGCLRLKAQDNDAAEVRFSDGSQDLVSLRELRLVCWATEE